MENSAAWIAANVSGINLSAIKEMAMRSAKVRDAASLTWGVPSFATPQHIREAVVRGLKANADIGKYSLPDGLPALRQAVAKEHFSKTGVEIDPDRNVVITAGNMEGLNALFHVLIDPGDEIIVTDPGFSSHFQQIRLCGGKTVFWPLAEAQGWALDVDALDRLITARTKAIVLVSPSNPTGKIFSKAELRRIGRIAQARNILILLDDPYSHFTYENRPRYFNLASMTELSNHLVYLFTFSKIYAMSGWRLGYMILPDFLKTDVMKVHDATMICAPRISQIAALAALTEEPVHLAEFEAARFGRFWGERRMLFNRERAELVMQRHGLDALVAASPDNVLYATNYECVTHWLNKGFQLYSLFSPGHTPAASLIAPSLELDAIVDGDVWVDDVYLFSPFPRGPAQMDAMDQTGRAAKALSERARHVGRALDGLVAAIESRALTKGRIGIDESGISPLFWWELQQRLPNVDIVHANAIWWEVRMVKTADEIERLTRASAIAETAIKTALRRIGPGTTEREVIDAYHSAVTARGGRSTFCILGSGSRTAQPHALASDKVIETGDLIRYDIGCTYGYYHADNARAAVLGTPSGEQSRIWEAMAQGVNDAVDLMRPGADVRDIYNAAMAPGQALGLENFERFHCGHGIGVSVYDPPVITLVDPATSAFLMPAVDGGLEAGMTFSIEVGYYIQGVMGFLCEDTVVVTDAGVRRLTSNSKSLDFEALIA